LVRCSPKLFGKNTNLRNALILEVFVNFNFFTQYKHRLKLSCYKYVNKVCTIAMDSKSRN
jgi:hypothetical protein